MNERVVAWLALLAVGALVAYVAALSIRQLRARKSLRDWMATAPPREVNGLLLRLILFAALSLGLVWLGYVRLQARLAVLAEERAASTPAERR